LTERINDDDDDKNAGPENDGPNYMKMTDLKMTDPILSRLAGAVRP